MTTLIVKKGQKITSLGLLREILIDTELRSLIELKKGTSVSKQDFEFSFELKKL